MIELVNRLRLDPTGEAGRLGLSAGEISSLNLPAHSLSVLAGNDDLRDAAHGHSSWMIATDTFSHTGAGGSNAGQRMAAAGYEFTGSWSWGENIGYRASSGTLDRTQAIHDLHLGLFLSDGHRANMLNENFREIGIGQANGDYLGYDATMVTQNFAASGGATFLTGVAYDDHDGDDFYSVGEGVRDVRVAFQGAATTTAAAGGYALGIVGTGWQTVTVTSGGNAIQASIGLGSANTKLDLVDGALLQSSASLRLLTGGTAAALLGLADLELAGNAAANLLTGNAGDNLITGGKGNDTIDGGAGQDTAVIGVASSEITVERNGDTVTVTSDDGTDTYKGVEYFRFSDRTVSFADLASGAAPASPAGDTPVYGTGEIRGTADADLYLGGPGGVRAYLAGGDDHYTGLSTSAAEGSDLVYLGTGNDTGLGGGGNDSIYGLGGDDSILGNDGADFLYGGGGNDSLAGGAGNDNIWAGTGHDDVHGDDGNDLIYGLAGNDAIFGGAGNDTIWGGDGNDTVTGGGGADRGYLGPGDDIFYDDPGDTAASPRDTVYLGVGNDTAYGTGGADIFHGLGGDDLIEGGGGADQIFGGSNADRIFGGTGDDLIFGGMGTDLIDMGAGDDVFRDTWQNGALGRDTITGGLGADTFWFTANSSRDVITDFELGIDTLRLPQRLWPGSLSAEDVVDRYATVTGQGVVFDFGNDMTITLQGLDSTDGLAGDLDLFG